MRNASHPRSRGDAPAQANRSSQQRRFDAFRYEYNRDRPHEALGQKPPVAPYNTSSRPYPKKLPELGKGLGEAIRGFKKAFNEDAKNPEKSETTTQSKIEE